MAEIVPFVNEGLGNSSYLIALDDDVAVMVDPDRSVGRYLREAEARNLRLAAVFETHLHADFVTGAVELAHATGASIYAPVAAHLKYGHHALKGEDSVRLANCEIEAVTSPGHTSEHLSYVLRAESQPPLLFSGGSLIVGGAARTDLVSPQMTEGLSRDQFRTLKRSFAHLPDETGLYPTHGGGSFCSAGAGGPRISTLGAERRGNPLLEIDDEDEFVRTFPALFPAAPAYFFRMREFNMAGPRLSAEIGLPGALAPADFEREMSGATVLDVRPIGEYSEGHIPGSLNIAFRESYATWLGWIVPGDARLLFVLGDADLQRVVEESLLVGYENFGGYLAGDIAAWKESGRAVRGTELASVSEAATAIEDGALPLDVGEVSEFAEGHIPGALNIPLGQLAHELDQIPRDRPIVAYCGHGERASTGVSLLEAAGYRNFVSLSGGMEAWDRHQK